MTEFETNQKRVASIDTELGDLQAQVDALNAKIEGLNQEKTQLATKIADEATESEQKRLNTDVSNLTIKYQIKKSMNLFQN